MSIPPQTVFLYSCKGGVGKSSICTNLAYTYSKTGIRTGIFDADFYGPSIPFMVRGLEQQKPNISRFTVRPGLYGDVRVNSVGFFMDNKEGMIWEDSYIDGALEQLLYFPEWETDAMFIDMPPGSGAIHRSVFSRVNGKAVIVTTPSELVYDVTARGIDILDRMQIDVIGIMENMAYHKCDNCKHERNVLDSDREVCESLGIPLIARLPYDPEFNVSNSGVPYVVAHHDTDLTDKFQAAASHIMANYGKNVTMRPRI